MLNTMRRAFSVVDVSRGWSLLYLASTMAASVMEAGGLAMVFVFFQVALSPENFGGIAAIGVLHEWLGSPDLNIFLAILSIVVVLFFAVRSTMLMISIFISATFRRKLQFNLTRKLLRAYLAQPYVWHQEKGTSRLISNVAQHTGGVVQHLILAALDIAGASITMVVLLGSMAFLRPSETIIAIVILGLSGTLFFVIFRGRLLAWGSRNVQAIDGLYRTVREAFRGIKVVKVQELQDFFAHRVENRVGEMMDIALRQSLIQRVPHIIFEMIVVTSVLLVVAFAFGSGVPASEIVPTMALFGAGAIRILPHVSKVLTNLQSIRMFEPALDAIRTDLFEMNLNQPSPKADPPPRPSGETLELHNVSFAYAGGQAPAVSDCSLMIARGDRIALAGLSGAGKTTLVDLLIGLLSPQSGRLVLDGESVERFPFGLFAYVPQEPFVISDTLRRNIALGQDNIDEEALARAIEGAALSDVVQRLPDGLDTVMSEDGQGLSGGERQRLGIARAFYRDAEFLVMDEPTSALDALTEAEVSSTLEGLGHSKTIILIAHRLSTIKKFNKIVFLQLGHIVAQGGFDELYSHNEQFQKMVDFLSVMTPSVIESQSLRDAL